MKKIIREVDEKKGIVQVTIVDERWYIKPTKGDEGIPEIIAVPSVTWISSKYPKGIAFYKWLADHGWSEAEAIKEAAGSKGSKVHTAIVDVILGKEIRIDSKYLNPKTEQEEELTLEECDAILSFVEWFKEVKPQVICFESAVVHDKLNYGGTIDLVCKIGNKYWIVDYKTGQNIWPEYELQVSAYKKVIADGYLDCDELKGILPEQLNLAILQVGYKKNKNGYKWTEIKDKFRLFLASQEIWANEHGDEKPHKRDYPIVLSPAKTEEVKQETPVVDKKVVSVGEISN